MAGKFSIYKDVKIEGKGWRYARAAYHPNGKIKPDADGPQTNPSDLR